MLLKEEALAREGRELYAQEALRERMSRQRKEQARRYFEQSEVAKVLSEFKDVLDTGVGPPPDFMRPRHHDSYFTYRKWGWITSEDKDHGMGQHSYWYGYNYFTIETTPEGMIYIRGNLFGSSTLSWKADRRSSKDAVDKACKHAQGRVRKAEWTERGPEY